tara:strand:+ start:876 stop:1025 length:150 start_codon:yes stop_codon:yes gene_type:complete
MSFGGGGAGTTALVAHTHNSGLSGDGGALSATLTQLDTSNLYSRIVVGG